MSIERLIESIGLPAGELKRYLLAEVDEFLAAKGPAEREEEFGDVLFALLSMAWAHSRRHYPLHPEVFESKVQQRLRTYATLTRHPRQYLHERIPELECGVLHFVFGQFSGAWQQFDSLKNGTIAEISLLTKTPFDRPDRLTNHCIVTFGPTEQIEYDILESSSDTTGGNTLRCQIPDFLFVRAKQELEFEPLAELLSLQALAALDGIRVTTGAIAHFHSWECGFLTESPEFRSLMDSFKTIFSPYLTTARLKTLVERSSAPGWTMTLDELNVAAVYERKLTSACMRVILESARDRDFYRNWVHPDRVEVRSFARERSASFPSGPSDAMRLRFLAGGRPVREKGFVELCREFVPIREWAASRGIAVSLSILCRERRPDKGAVYLDEIERVVEEYGLLDSVSIEPKVSMDQLRRRIAGAAAVITPSLYDAFCLMPTYAVEVGRPAFVSCHAGVSENIKSRQFIFDPLVEGTLLRAIKTWYDEHPLFEYESCYPTYRDLYLARDAAQPWG